jgi:hypothetical protein
MSHAIGVVSNVPGAASEAELPAACPRPICDLVGALGAARVRYCHWKSNIRLAESLAGEEDLDLLVARADAARFAAVLPDSGFKLARSISGPEHPAMFHAFALDEMRGRLLHLHAYFQLLTGDSLAKSYHLPIEGELLSKTRVWKGIPTPLPELELALFVLRIMLKHTGLAEIALVSRGYAGVVRELAWLAAAADHSAAAELWCAWVPGATPEMFDRTVEAIAAPRAIVERIALGRRLARQLRGWRRLGAAAAPLSRWRQIAVMALGRIRRRRDFALQSGGLIIAVVGPKASGKSTLSAELVRRLGKHLDVRRVHAGKPPVTLVTILPRLMTPLARAIFPGERTGEYEKPERRSQASYSLLHIFRMVLLAYDRRALLRRCWRDAASGALVVADRYPSVTIGAIDSRRFDDDAVIACGSALKRWLMRREQALCASLPRPGLVLRLAVCQAAAVRRDALRLKVGGPDAGAVLRRWNMETSGDFGSTPVSAVATDRALEETATELMRAVWTAL